MTSYAVAIVFLKIDTHTEEYVVNRECENKSFNKSEKSAL